MVKFALLSGLDKRKEKREKRNEERGKRKEKREKKKDEGKSSQGHLKEIAKADMG